MDVAKIMHIFTKRKLWDISLKTFNDFNVIFFALKAIEGVGFDKPQLGDKGPTVDVLP
jgi:hypothetical protein